MPAARDIPLFFSRKMFFEKRFEISNLRAEKRFLFGLVIYVINSATKYSRDRKNKENLKIGAKQND